MFTGSDHAAFGTGTSVPGADAMTIIARPTRIDPCLPRRAAAPTG
jgi:hypothetical protein